jgi:AP2 domain
MKEIRLTQGKVALVDDADFELVSKWKWHAVKSPRGSVFYAARNIKSDRGWRIIKMHQVILGFPGFRIDHRNGNGLDNQRGNLRQASQMQNCHNTSARAASGYKGVYFHPHSGRWQSKIMVNWKTRSLGYYQTKEEAAAAYDAASFELVGEFTRPNLTHV